jgi:hypothetical protein
VSIATVIDSGGAITAEEGFAASARLRTPTADPNPNPNPNPDPDPDPDAEYRDGQLEAIRDVVGDRARVLCVQRTSWGKSAVYFLATARLREVGPIGVEHRRPMASWAPEDYW